MAGLRRAADVWFRTVPVLGMLAAAGAVAGNPVTEVHGVRLPPGSLAIGVGFRFGDSPYRGIDDLGSDFSSADFDTFPFYYFEGERLFAHGSTGGLHLFGGETFKLDAILDYRFDRLEPQRDSFFRTVEPRRQSLDGGVEASLAGDLGRVSLSWVHDTLDRHNGSEVELTYRYDWRHGRFTVSPFASLVYQDQGLLDYYYGVSRAEAREDLPAYRADAGLQRRLGVNTAFDWTPRLKLYANLAVEQLDDAVTDSPLVDDDVVATAMVGALLDFGSVSSGELVVRAEDDHVRDWSWRINYGYTAEETFHKLHRGQIKGSEDVDTHLLGLTLGKLVLDGPRAEMWGKFSVNRRLEDDLQDDFFEFNAHFMLMGTGYSPWSSRELFRYGFGYGVSYAEEISAIEQIKQDGDENTSRFLNYLEAQLDFPLRNLLGNRGWWRDCYAGLTIVHRSGVFGRVDIFGNVAGGSDVLSGHLECKR